MCVVGVQEPKQRTHVVSTNRLSIPEIFHPLLPAENTMCICTTYCHSAKSCFPIKFNNRSRYNPRRLIGPHIRNIPIACAANRDGRGPAGIRRRRASRLALRRASISYSEKDKTNAIFCSKHATWLLGVSLFSCHYVFHCHTFMALHFVSGCIFNT